MLEPLENPEIPIRYTPGLICSIKLKAFLFNFTRFDNLYVQVMEFFKNIKKLFVICILKLKYSDYEIQYIPVDLRKIRIISPNKHSLDLDVFVSNSSWTGIYWDLNFLLKVSILNCLFCFKIQVMLNFHCQCYSITIMLKMMKQMRQIKSCQIQ